MNIILVMSDSFRYDNLSCYGETEAKAPRLDKFAHEAFVFNNAYLGSFPTIPNRLDIMSGRFSFINQEWQPLPHETVTLQQILSASGFITQMIADNPHLVEMGFNYDRGFTAWEWIRGQETDKWRTAPKNVKVPDCGKKLRTPTFIQSYLRNTAWWKSEEDRFAPRTIKTACKWLEENQDQEKFFLYIDLFDPHEPWDAPEKYLRLYESDYEGDDLIYPNYGFWKELFTEEELNHIYALYMAEASMVDHWFGVLLDKIEELGMNEDTAVIFTSDHGYLFGEHGLTGKSLFPEVNGKIFYEAIPMYDEIRRIPLLVRLPGQTEERRINSLVQAPDLMPTILEMAGLVSTQTIEGKSEIQALQCGVFYTEEWEFRPENIHGSSLMPLMNGEKDRLRDIIICSNTLVHHTPILARCAIVTDDGWCLHYAGSYEKTAVGGGLFTLKLINPSGSRIPPGPELYFLPDDPKESKDLVDKNKSLAKEIHHRYVKWLQEVGTPEEHFAGRRKFR